jgi:hypothetical protein
MAPPYSISYISSTHLLPILLQLDSVALVRFHGNPNASVAAGSQGQFGVDLDSNAIWVCTATDQTGDPAGTTWSQTNLLVVNASSSTPGIIQIATQVEVDAGVVNSKAVVPSTLAHSYARKDANNDITSLIADFTTPLKELNGGTNHTSFLAALLANLPSPFVSGAFISNDGSNLLWKVPIPSLSIIGSNGSLSYNTFNLVTNNSLTLNLPAGAADKIGQAITVAFSPSVTTGPTINTAGSDLLMGASGPLNMNNLDRGIILTWTGVTLGWFVAGLDS